MSQKIYCATFDFVSFSGWEYMVLAWFLGESCSFVFSLRLSYELPISRILVCIVVMGAPFIL